MVTPGVADVKALTNKKVLAVATLFCVVKVEAVEAKLIAPAKLAVIAAPAPEDVKPKL